VNKGESNNIIGAIGKPSQFSCFSAAFIARLKRIAKAVHLNQSLLKPVKQALNQIADSKNWEGAYAELAAIDFWLAAPDTAEGRLTLDVTIPAIKTLADEIGQQDANFDGHLKLFDIFFDTKALTDKIGDILDGIIQEAQKKAKIQITILPNYDIDMPFELFQKKRKELYNELLIALDPQKQAPMLKSLVIDGLTYRFAWRAGVLTGASTYDPIEHAINHHTLLFKHAKKFHRSTPSLIVFVNFPWYGEKIFPLGDSSSKFYAEFSRLFFNFYLNKNDEAKQYNNSFISGITAEDVTKYLSGILFLEDNCVLSETPDQVNINAYYYLNPHAKNSLINTEFSQYLAKRCINPI
jgi:hypothetical protein